MTASELKRYLIQRTKQLMAAAVDRTTVQQKRYKKAFDRTVRSTPQIKAGDEVFIDKPPAIGKSLVQQLADGPATKLSKRATSAYRVTRVTDKTVTVKVDGIEDTVSIDRVTLAPPSAAPDRQRHAQTHCCAALTDGGTAGNRIGTVGSGYKAARHYARH